MSPIIRGADIAIVGAGGCGLTAALTAADLGARVLLLEKDTHVGGTTAMSAGLMVAAGSRLQIDNGETGSALELAADILNLNRTKSDPVQTQALCDASGPLVDWLQTQGIPLEHLDEYKYPEMTHFWLLAPPERHGAVMTQALSKRIAEEPNITLRLGTGVEGLLFDGAEVHGIHARTPDGESYPIQASAVILAASGFGANPKMVSRYIPAMTGAAYFGAPYATGDAISWSQAIGAGSESMGAYQPHSSIAYPEMLLVTTYLINHGAIQVNQEGRRFGDETKTYSAHATRVQEQTDKIVIEVFDEYILQATLANYPRFQECIEAGIVQNADSLINFADSFGIEPNNLSVTVDSFNGNSPEQQDEFGRFGTTHKLVPPFYGVRVTSAVVQTLGGVKVNEFAQVMRPDGTVIPGLFAGGGTAAGLAGNTPEGYLAGTGLLAAFGLGWIAGQEAAKRLQRD